MVKVQSYKNWNKRNQFMPKVQQKKIIINKAVYNDDYDIIGYRSYKELTYKKVFIGEDPNDSSNISSIYI